MTTNQAYLNLLIAAAEWGLDDKRPAWIRTLAELENEPGTYDLSDVRLAKLTMLGDARRCLESWQAERFRVAPALSLVSAEQKEPQYLWEEMVQLNTELVASGPDPLGEFIVPVPSLIPGMPPLWLLPNLDGWGIRRREAGGVGGVGSRRSRFQGE